MVQVDNKRIAKNTLYMYLRMLVTVFVSLFTTRIVFKALGVDNFGIYNVVGSIIVFFTFINSGLTTATRRYITAELAQGNEESQRNVFNIALYAHILISVVVLVLGETIGLWVVNHILSIPDERLFAANVVYQLSILSAILNIMQAPFTAAITANERMNIYAYLSILDVVLKLAVAYFVMASSGDKLIVYAVCIFLIGFLNIIANRWYCYHSFVMCRYKRPYNKALLKELFGYMGWNLAGQGTVVLTNQGVSVLVNLFYTVAANAAMGVSNQITGVVSHFVSNFQVAFHPQITKLYVSKSYTELTKLANRSSRLSSYLVLLFLIPICFQVKNFLTIWLGDYPEYALEFCVFTLVAIYIDSISAPFWMILSADKDVKHYQIVISSIYSLNFLGAWIVLKSGYLPYSVIVIRIVVYGIAVIARLMLVKERMPSFSVRTWMKEVPLKSLSVAALPALSCFFIRLLKIDNSVIELLVKGGTVFMITLFAITFLGLSYHERSQLLNSVFRNMK